MLSVTFWSCPEQFCWYSGCIHNYEDTGCLLSIVQMHFSPECSRKVKSSLEFITEKRLLLWDLSGIEPRRAESSPPQLLVYTISIVLSGFTAAKLASSSRQQELSFLQSCTAAPQQEGFLLFVSHLGGGSADLVPLHCLYHPASEPINLA